MDFYRYWKDYVDGFGTLRGEYWIGEQAVRCENRNTISCHLFIPVLALCHINNVMRGGIFLAQGNISLKPEELSSCSLMMLLGLEALHYLTNANRKASFYLEDHDGEVRTANYSGFHINPSGSNYTLNVSLLHVELFISSYM